MSVENTVAPIPARQIETSNHHGRLREDPYVWIRVNNWRDVVDDVVPLSGDVASLLRKENEYTEAVLRKTRDIQLELYAETQRHLDPMEMSITIPDGPYEYYTRFEPKLNLELHARRPRGTWMRDNFDFSHEELLLDENKERYRKGSKYYAIINPCHSRDHQLFAYAEDVVGGERYTIQVKDINTGKLCKNPAQNAYGDFRFSWDSRWLFWVQLNDSGRSSRVYRRLARGTDDDVLIYEERDLTFSIGISTTSSDQFFLIVCENQDTSEVLYVPASDPTAEPLVVAPRKNGEIYEVEHWFANDFFLRTNAGGADDFKIMTVSAVSPGRENWTDWLIYRPGYCVQEVHARKDYLVWKETHDADDYVMVVSASDAISNRGRDAREFARPLVVGEQCCVVKIVPTFEYTASTIYLVESSPTTPQRWYIAGLAAMSGKNLLKQQGTSVDRSLYVTDRVWAIASDGSKVPVTVSRLHSTPIDGSAPAWVEVYGAYGCNVSLEFSPSTLSLISRGWVAAVAHVRGGDEKGTHWYHDGRLDKKMNTFTDLVTVCEHLVSVKYTSTGRIVLFGSSAGGLAVGATLNLAPEGLFAGAVCDVPFVDVLGTMLDASLPLTPVEYTEWGNPAGTPEEYDIIAAYSPYDNVSADKEYPPVLAIAGVHDTRVTYWEPIKWIAALRHAGRWRANPAPAMCLTNMHGGHMGDSNPHNMNMETARMHAFAVWAVDRAGDIGE